MLSENVNFGFIKSEMDGTEHMFGAPESQRLPESYSYRMFLPRVLNQGSEPICVPCSVSAWLNWRENLETGSRRDNKIDYHEIYKIRTNDGEGMTYKEALHYLRHHGVKSDVGNLKIGEYAMVRNYDSLRAAIVMNGPCLGALPVYGDRPAFWDKLPRDGFYGFHAISIVGYDKRGFIIRNSWGTGFGDGGYTVLPYEDFNRFLEIWTIIN